MAGLLSSSAATSRSLLARTAAIVSSASSDIFTWTNANGGVWGTASNWMDTTVGAVASASPGAGSTVLIAGGSNNQFTPILGNGSAAQLPISGDVLLEGAVTVSGTVTLAGTGTELDIDNSANLSVGALSLASGSTVEANGGSSLQVSGLATVTDSILLAIGGSVMQFGTLIANGAPGLRGLDYGIIAVDSASSMEIGTSGGAVLGAITVDAGQTAVISGALDGNLVINGTLAVQAGASLAIDVNDPFGTPSGISGGGVLAITQGSCITLGVADSASIRFSDPSGTLVVSALPSGTISGFTASDTIEVLGLATGLSYTQPIGNTAILTLRKGLTTTGVLTLAGNYTGSVFHLRLDSSGNGFITVQTVGTAAAQPTLIVGTAGSDVLTATANAQTISGYGGRDILSDGGFARVVFKDASAALNGDTLMSFGVSDTIDLTDVVLASATVTATAAVFSHSASPVSGSLVVNDGSHAATITMATSVALPPGIWQTVSDGASGTLIKYVLLNTDAYTFQPILSANYGVLSNWRNATVGATATTLPGIGNAVTLSGGTLTTDVSGNGVAGSLLTTGSVLLMGTIAVGVTTVSTGGFLLQTGTLALDSAARLILTGSASVGGMLEVGGGSTLTAADVLTFSSSYASLLALNGSRVQFASVATSGPSLYAPASISVDTSSSIELGSLGTVTTGALTIDSGIAASLGGTINGNVVVNGTLAASGRTLTIAPFGGIAPSVTGTGTLQIDGGGTLAVLGSERVPIAFTPSGGVLSLGTTLPNGTISGFGQGDAIALNLQVTSVIYNATTGTLTLLSGTTTIGTLTLAGIYTASQFQVQFAPGSKQSTITYAATPNTAAGNQVGTNSDSYTWTNTSGGVWSNNANWLDTRTGQSASSGPGTNNAITIQDNPGTLTEQIISGSGAASSLTVYATSNTVFTGTIAVAGLLQTWGNAGFGMALQGGAQFTAGSIQDYANLLIAGGSALTVAGNSDGTEIVGTIEVTGNSRFKASGFIDFSGGSVAVDSTSTVEFGSTGAAATGILTIDAGQVVTIEENGAINGRLVVNGTLIVANGTISGFGGIVAPISGSGVIQIGSTTRPGRLTLISADSAPLVFSPIAGYGTLEIAGSLPTGTINGFVQGDLIQIDRTVTGVNFVQTSGTQGILTLTNGGSNVGTLSLLGNYAGQIFKIDVSGVTGYATISLATAAGIAGTAIASTNRDTYSWAGGSGGTWTTASNWVDTTLNATPATVPGNGNNVTVSGAATIGGNGAAGNLTINGNNVITGQITVANTLTVAPSVASTTPASLDLMAGATVTAVSAAITGIVEAEASTLSVSSGATLTGGSLLAFSGSSVTLASLTASGAGNLIAVDANSVIKIGALASGTVGSITEAAGVTTALTGAIFGNMTINGTIAVAGGGTLSIDMTGSIQSNPYGTWPAITGAGMLSIGEKSTLALGVSDTAAIQFAAPGGILMLAALPTATISGFAVGDQIQVYKAVTGLSYRQISSSLGTLTLTNGATTVGSMSLSGTYTANAFHLDVAPNGNLATISLQTLGIAPTQPILIQGSKSSDVLIATAGGQILTGLGGADTLYANGFTGINFKDTTANLNLATLPDFATGDSLDITDLSSTSGRVSYANGILSVSDGTHSAGIRLAFLGGTPASGGFTLTSDGIAGSIVSWH